MEGPIAYEDIVKYWLERFPEFDLKKNYLTEKDLEIPHAVLGAFGLFLKERELNLAPIVKPTL